MILCDRLLCTVQGCYAGNALGFRVTSLTKLIDTRSNKPRLTLLHFLVDEFCRQNDSKDSTNFVDALSQPLTIASRYDQERRHFCACLWPLMNLVKFSYHAKKCDLKCITISAGFLRSKTMFMLGLRNSLSRKPF